MQSKSKISLTPTDTFDDGDKQSIPDDIAQPQATAHTASAESAGNGDSASDEPTLKQSLTESLASILFIDASTIGQHQSFEELGLDSVLAVEWIREINKAYGIEIEAVEIYDHASVAKMCELISSKLQGDSAASADAGADNEGTTSSESDANTGTSSGPDITALKKWLSESLASILFIDTTQVGAQQSFEDLGLDSVLAVEWIREINKHFGIDIEATQIYDHATIAKMCELVSQLLNPSEPSASEQPSASATKEPAAEQSNTGAMDLNEILAKVQSGELDITEADKLITQIQNS